MGNFAAKPYAAIVMTFLEKPDDIILSATIPDIIVNAGTVACVSVSVTLTVDITQGDNATRKDLTLLSENLYPAEDGTVRVTDLSQLLLPYMREYWAATVKATFAQPDGFSTLSAEFHVLLAEASVVSRDSQDTVRQFLASHFLTLLDGTKTTAYGRREYLYALCDAGDNDVFVPPMGSIRAQFLTASGTETLEASIGGREMMRSTGYYCCVSYDASPDNIAACFPDRDARKMIAYTMTVGNRRQTFQMTAEYVPSPCGLMFTNSFGVQETLYSAGSMTREVKYTRSTARIAGETRNYKIDTEQLFKVSTGWLNDAMAQWAGELLRSMDVLLLRDRQQLQPIRIVITEAKEEQSYADDALTAYSLTWKYAAQCQNVAHGMTGRIHAYTFDGKFN